MKLKTILRKIVFVIGLLVIIGSIGFFIFIKIDPFGYEFLYNDGPYLFYLNDTTIKSLTIEADDKNGFTIKENEFTRNDSIKSLTIGENVFKNFNAWEKFQFSSKAEYTADKIAAVSDIHGAYNHFKTLLQRNAIIDDSLNWIWGKGHLVIVGDVFDKGPHVTETLWLIRKLETQAKNGGEVHFLLGNHEMMTFEGRSGAVKKYRTICQSLGMSYSALFGNDSYLGRWLRTRKSIVKINNSLFVHGGISEELIRRQFSLEDINKYFNIYINSNHLLNYDQATRNNISFLKGHLGPMWYNGYFDNFFFYIFAMRGQSSKFDDGAIAQLLKPYNAENIIVGHTIVQNIKALYNNQVVAIDIRLPLDDVIKNDEDYQMLIIEGSKHYRAKINGEKELLSSK